ncbi:hypothetical protein IFM51744_09088 [Aspergillus udagawae]|nr:hypothetical protein IFM51744_09088 [Aspergillus udagawae]
MASAPCPGTVDNPIRIDDEYHETPEMTAIPTITEDTAENSQHGLPFNVFFLDDDQRTVSTEVATPPPALTEDMAEGNLHVPPHDIERAQEQEGTDSGIPPGSINAATIDGEHTSHRSSIGISQGTGPVHPVHPIPPNGIQESARTPRPANRIYFGCNAPDSAAEESSVAYTTLRDFLFSFLPNWEIIRMYPDNGFLEVQLRIPATGARKRPAPEPEPAADDGPVDVTPAPWETSFAETGDLA